MNTKLLLAIISVAVFSSCTTLYKSGQTPDDVYYSPARSYGDGNQSVREEREEQPNRDEYSNQDRAIRMGINDSRWRYLDYDYGYNNSFYSPYSQYYSSYNYGFNHGYYYNPYFWPYPVYSPVFTVSSNPKITTPRTNNLGGYGAIKGYNNAPASSTAPRTAPIRRYNNNNGTGVGNAIRRVLGSDNQTNSTHMNNNNSNTRTYTPANNNNNTNNNNSNNNRSYTPSSSSSSSSGSSSSGSSGGGVSRPPRSGGK
ncbi:MAG: hypothetical protein ABIN67_18080 [Ferruginibacter sp.]